ncbi:hypothetical protein PC116_g22355 [Phytophthora cactorum]|uniref:Uncharacterized protein n=1 Tax=Phytophthora cactorum TaxID=29920 RepID=A0A8T1JWY1_9STRA|nr:hypothetical protein PC114_g19935 [Phytophthora cactorum]KAG2909777.1 hypothetical protein PC117_g19576 [Phytophthora cactorum]KAG4229309.1 hypothetical protein PC116_g22355 [Phytophthora cactorum]
MHYILGQVESGINGLKTCQAGRVQSCCQSQQEQWLGDAVWKTKQEFPDRSVTNRHAMALSHEV